MGELEREPCIEWPKSRMANGYGRAWHNGAVTTAHRAVWEKANGPIPAGLDVCHTCDNRPCVNLAHLFLGTREQNVADMIAKGRNPYGERNGQAKLTDDLVRSIRAQAADGVSHAELARRFGVDQGTITPVVARRTWKHVC